MFGTLEKCSFDNRGHVCYFNPSGGHQAAHDVLEIKFVEALENGFFGDIFQAATKNVLEAVQSLQRDVRVQLGILVCHVD